MTTTVFLKKVFKRLEKIFIKITPYNKFYRPKGFYKTVDEYMQSAAGKKANCIEIYAGYVSRLNMPEEFISKCLKFERMATVAVASIPPARVVIIPGGRLYTEGVENVSIITSDNKLLGEVTYQNHPSNKIEENILLKQTYFVPVTHYKGVVFHTLIGGSGPVNYYHWLIDSLPRLHLLKQSGWYDKVDWFVMPALKTEFHRESIRILGINKDKIIESDVATYLHIQADLLIASTFVRHNEHVPAWCCYFLREHFLKPQPFTDFDAHPYVYISRKDARRRITNEPELEEILEKYGFKSYELSRLSFREKIQLFNNAKVIIGTHGAGQTNVVFCKKGTHMLEFIPEGLILPYYYDLANHVGVNFNYLIFKSTKQPKSVRDGMNLDIIADLNAVKEKLDKIMAVNQA